MNGALVRKYALMLALGMSCMSFVQAQSTKNKVTATPKKSAQTTGKDKEVKPIDELLASNFNLTDKKDIIDFATAVNKSIGYDASSAEDLEYPSIDLYGEDSWSEWVNPFAGGASVEIPETYSVDCSQFSYPLDGVRRVNSQYGYRRSFGRMHYGVDLQVSIGDTVRAVFDGKVRIVDNERAGYGKYIVVRHTNGLETVYGHLSRYKVKENDIVRAGDPIGFAGNTGRSTGPHLHFETRFLGIALNPEHLINFNTGVPKKDQYVFNRRQHGNAKNTRVAQARTATRRSSADAGGANIEVHRIRRGDTLASIAKRYGTSVSKLCKLNGISSRAKLRPGKTLRVNS